MAILSLGGFRTRDPIDVTRFDSFQDAIDAIESGGVLKVPAGTYTSTTTPAVDTMDLSGKSIYVLGDGVGASYVKHDSGSNTDLITLNDSDHCRIEGIRFEGTNASGTGRWMVVNDASYCRFYDCWVDMFPSWCVDSSGATVDSGANRFSNIRFTRSVSNGALKLGTDSASKSFHWIFDQCIFEPAAGQGASISWAQRTAFRDCAFQQSHDTGANGYASAHVHSNGFTIGPVFDNCWFENTANNATPNNWFIYVRAGTNPLWSIRDCHFVRTGAATTKIRLFKSEGNCQQLKLDNCYASIANATADGTDDLVIHSSDTGMITGGQLRYNADGSLKALRVSGVNGTACFNANMKLKGIPISEAARDALTDPGEGDLIFNTTSKVFNFHNGTSWGAI